MARDFWAFGSPDDDSPENISVVPPGYRLARGIPTDAPLGKFLSCRSCGALVASTDNGVSRHKQFHERLREIATALGMNYSPDNPNILLVAAECAQFGFEAHEVQGA